MQLKEKLKYNVELLDGLSNRVPNEGSRHSLSLAVAIYGLRHAAQEGKLDHGTDTKQFFERHFYIDDWLMSLPTNVEAIDTLKRTQNISLESNLRLHKIASNSPSAMKAFLPENNAKAINDIEFCGETSPMQRSLGMCWEITTDTFTFRVFVSNNPFTRHGVLFIVNSLFDPLGLVVQ